MKATSTHRWDIAYRTGLKTDAQETAKEYRRDYQRKTRVRLLRRGTWVVEVQYDRPLID